jgi:glycosyltransferase involved in cell wall biosynthesis
MNILISYGILACKEHVELKKLLDLLFNTIDKDQSEIVLLLDENNTTEEVQEVVSEFINKQDFDNFNVFHRSLNNNFSEQKNYLNSKCVGKYIFQIDADELLTAEFITYLPKILNTNPNVDLFYIPRINIVDNISREYILSQGWRVNELGHINSPDYQSRLYRNNSDIHWENKVHETIKGHKSYHSLPNIPLFCILHYKTFEKQKTQNDFYNQL